MRAPKVCSDPECVALVYGGRSRCPEHARDGTCRAAHRRDEPADETSPRPGPRCSPATVTDAPSTARDATGVLRNATTFWR